MKVEIDNYESDCGFACTPDGCFGHDSGIPETIYVDDFGLTLRSFVQGDWPFLGEDGAEIPGEVERWKRTVAKIEEALKNA